jgi:saccharopine dehydrogenase-like NADP-dependent oxidoreductase
MKHVVVLGAGMVARPAIAYLCERENLTVTVTDVDGRRAQALAADVPGCSSRALDASDTAAVERLFEGTDLCISLLPSSLDYGVARMALASATHFVGVSSRRESRLEGFDADARQAGLTFLPEAGLDPGLEHMSIASMKGRIEGRGGQVVSCRSYCGGLPAPEANTNPWGYKFSWNPSKAVQCAQASARYLENGQEIDLPGDLLFSRHWLVDVPGFGELEAHFNRDSVPYVDIYGLSSAETMQRATLRYPGWSLVMGKIGRLGYLDTRVMSDPPDTYAELTRRLAGVPAEAELVAGLARSLDVDLASTPITCITWLGLVDDDPIVWRSGQPHTPLEALANLMQEKMTFGSNERDVCVMQNELECLYPSGTRESWTSTLIEYGQPGGDSAMARTVGFTAAVAATKILNGQITDRGVLLPVLPSIYGPVLDAMERLGIAFTESVEVLS